MIVKDKIYIDTSKLGFHISKLCEKFTYHNPEYWQKKNAKRSVKNIDQYLFNYKLDGTTLALPRGAIKKVNEFLAERNIYDRILDQRVETPEIDVSLCNTTIEPQQEKIINTLLTHEGGLIEMATAGGKSIAILGYIATIKQRTLILVDEFRLSNQWIGEIEKRLTGSFSLGEFNGDKKKIGDITVAIINSAYIRYKEDPTFFDQFGIVVIDETQQLPAHMFMSVVNNTSGKYRIGITATPKRRDGKEILMFDVLGPVLLAIKSHEVKHRVTDFEFKMINTDLKFTIPTKLAWNTKKRKREKAIDFTKCLTELVDNKDRNDIIVNEVVDIIKEGYIPLIISDRVKHNTTMYQKLLDLGYNVELLIGDTRKKTDLMAIKNNETLQCIVANTRILSKGLDIPRLSALVLTCPSGNLPKLEQQVGRIRRNIPDKKTPLVVDFCDNLAKATVEDSEESVEVEVFMLKRMATKRTRHYVKMQEEYQSMF